MKFHIITLGCKVNAYESNFISESLVNNGFSFCNEIKDADIIIINTCSVTDTSDKKSLKVVKRCKRENENALLIVIGCSSQNDYKPYEKVGANIILGTKHKSKVPELIEKYLKDRKNIIDITTDRDTEYEQMNINTFDHVRAYIKIEDGCNNFCSYCIIPYLRGSVRSKDYKSILNEANDLVNQGFKEIVLTGIDTASYSDSNKDFSDLIEDLSKIDNLERIRLSSVEITQLNDKFLNVLKTNKKLCNHIHIPLQSGSDEILKKMNRKYDTKYFEEKINTIRSIRPDISITTDVIVGHNYETDELFDKAYEFCKKIKFSKIHVFPYSKRSGTATSRMPMEVDEGVKKVRARKLINLSEFLEKEYYDSFKGKEIDILIEKCEDGKSYGHTSNYLYVCLDETLEVGKIYKRIL